MIYRDCFRNWCGECWQGVETASPIPGDELKNFDAATFDFQPCGHQARLHPHSSMGFGKPDNESVSAHQEGSGE